MLEYRSATARLSLITLIVANAPLLAEAAPPPAVEVERPPERSESPMAMNNGHHAKVICGNGTDLANKLVCISWLNGASAGNGWTQSRAPAVFPDYCPPAVDFNLEQRRALFMEYLNKASEGKLGEPAILLFREAMAGAYPCAVSEAK